MYPIVLYPGLLNFRYKETELDIPKITKQNWFVANTFTPIATLLHCSRTLSE